MEDIMILYIIGGIIFSSGSIYIRVVPKEKWNLNLLIGIIISGGACLIFGSLSLLSYIF